MGKVYIGWGLVIKYVGVWIFLEECVCFDIFFFVVKVLGIVYGIGFYFVGMSFVVSLYSNYRK